MKEKQEDGRTLLDRIVKGYDKYDDCLDPDSNALTIKRHFLRKQNIAYGLGISCY